LLRCFTAALRIKGAMDDSVRGNLDARFLECGDEAVGSVDARGRVGLPGKNPDPGSTELSEVTPRHPSTEFVITRDGRIARYTAGNQRELHALVFHFLEELSVEECISEDDPLHPTRSKQLHCTTLLDSVIQGVRGEGGIAQIGCRLIDPFMDRG